MIFTNTWLVFRWCLAGFLYFGAITESGMKGALYSWNREIKFHSEVMVRTYGTLHRYVTTWYKESHNLTMGSICCFYVLSHEFFLYHVNYDFISELVYFTNCDISMNPFRLLMTLCSLILYVTTRCHYSHAMHLCIMASTSLIY